MVLMLRGRPRLEMWHYYHTDAIDKIVGKLDKQKRGPWTNPRGIRGGQRDKEEPVRRQENEESVNSRSKESASWRKE